MSIVLLCAWCAKNFAVKNHREKTARCCCRSCDVEFRVAQARQEPEPTSVPGARWVPLTGGKFALVDAGDFDDVSGFSWCRAGGYACRRSGGETVSMHRHIMSVPRGIEVDHVDGDVFNNRRSNLRLATRQQQTQNQRLRRTNTSGYVGVCWHRGEQRWAATIRVEGRYRRIGAFMCPIEAAKAYDEWARRHRGEYATLNFPLDGERSVRRIA